MGNQPPAGGLFHACGFDDKGNLHVADVRESAETMNEFVNKRLMPGMKKLWVPPPDVNIFPLHNMNVYQTAQKFLLKKAS